MMKRAIVMLAFITAGFAAGLVLTGRMRTAGESEAQPPRRTTARRAARPASGAGQRCPI